MAVSSRHFAALSKGRFARAKSYMTSPFYHRITAHRVRLSEFPMSHITYRIVQHDDGWAYTVNGVFSETFASHAAALAAAKRVAAEQRTPGRTEVIEYETSDGRWHTETAPGSDRPETEVEDKP